MTLETPSRPILRYHGGKWELGPWIIGHFPAHRVYTEVYGGGGSVLLRKPRSYAEIYNDLDGEVVNLFQVVRNHGPALRAALEMTPYARKEFDLSYEPTTDPIERARRIVVRSYMGFGGNLGRPTASGKPQRTGFRMTSHDSGKNCAKVWQDYPKALDLITERMRGVVIENRDAVSVILRNDTPNSLHYVDPPYVKATRDRGSDYRFEMTDDDHRELAAVLNSVKGAVVLSGYPSELYNELFADWHRVERKAQADGARERTEVLWLRNIQSGADLFTTPTTPVPR